MPCAAARMRLFDAATASGAFCATLSASAIAASSAPPCSVSSLSKPQSKACSAVIGSPVMAICIAVAYPTLAGSLNTPPAAANSPTFTSLMPIFAPFEATNRSQVSAISQPPAMAKPSIAAMRGLLQPSRTNVPRGPISSPRANALRSMPEQNPRPLPVITPAVSESSASSS